LIQNNQMQLIQEKTGLRIDPYFSAGKLVWLLEHVDGLKALAQQGHVAFGTIDSWLIWNLTQGAEHVIEASNASRTMLMNLHPKLGMKNCWNYFKFPHQFYLKLLHPTAILQIPQRVYWARISQLQVF